MGNEADRPTNDIANVINGDLSGVQAGIIHGDVHVHASAEPGDEVPAVFDHVPETQDEIAYVISHRPWEWPYVLYAGVLQVGLRDIKRRPEERGKSPLTFADRRAAISHASPLLDELDSILEDFRRTFDVQIMSKAFGEPGRPGEWRLVTDIARRQVAAYEKMRAWAVSVRTAKVPRQVHRAYELTSHVADQPMGDIEIFVGRLVSGVNDMLGEAARDLTRSHVLSITCDLTVDNKLLAELTKEIARAGKRW
ncbi:hypothetical protein [Kutzneria sp. NPDC052558]|uniref:hypothetical protein n=1 Tax=Kutzneria sp. NPDC052558 TaxID=3364121 RepID=UPI0037C56891